MQVLIRHSTEGHLELPLSYHHIIQGIIYNNLSNAYGYSDYLHEEGAHYGQRNFKLFTFSKLRGKYKIKDKRIIFYDTVEFEISSPNIFMIRMLADNILKNGIQYGEKLYRDITLYLSDSSIEEEDVIINMLSPICVYSYDEESGRTYYYSPDDQRFGDMINDNFIRKYIACYGVAPSEDIAIETISVTEKDKYVTKYKGIYINGWFGKYRLKGKRKYLDFLYQTGLGAKNSQGFGMFEQSDI